MSRTRRAAVAAQTLVVTAAVVVSGACGVEPPATTTPAAPGPTPPATVSGPLTAANLPEAREIGPRFRPHVVPDAPDEAFVSNGTAVRARSPKETADGIVPLGCLGLDRLGRLPVPAYALEQTYRTPEHQAAVALVLEYATTREASTLVGKLASMLQLCAEPVSTQDRTTPRLVANIRRPDAGTLLDNRREVGASGTEAQWDETVVRAGRRVGLVIVERTPDTIATRSQSALTTVLRKRLGS
jgi:hypothetical protein